jgi:hypothetical protein
VRQILLSGVAPFYRSLSASATIIWLVLIRERETKHHAILLLILLDQRVYHEPGSTTAMLVEVVER